MKESKFLGQIGAFQSKEKRQRRWIGFLVFVVIVMLITIMHLSNRQISVIYPQFPSQHSYKISSNAVTPDYLMDLARGDASMVFTVDSANVQYQTKQFLKRLMPSYYGTQAPKFEKVATDISKSNASYSYQISPKMSVKGTTVTVTGVRTTEVAGNVVDYGNLDVTIDYEVSNGFVYIKSWNWKYESHKNINK